MSMHLKENSEEKLVALEMLEPVQVSNSRSKDIKHKYKVTYTKQLRDELLGGRANNFYEVKVKCVITITTYNCL